MLCYGCDSDLCRETGCKGTVGYDGRVPEPPYPTEDDAEARRLALEESAALCERQADHNDRGDQHYDSGAGSLGYAKACQDCADAIRALIST